MRTIFCLLLSLVILSCEKGNPIASDNSIDEKYLGLPTTTREYISTTWMFEPNTSTPFIKVPDSLLQKMSFDSVSIRAGVVKIYNYQEIVIPKDTSYNKLNYYDPNTIYCQIKTQTIDYRNLETELDYVKNGKTYTGSTGSHIDGTTYAENANEYFTQFDDRSKYYLLKKPLSVGMEWIRDQRQHKTDNGNYELFQTICRVVSKENITVKAGNFAAFKVEVSSYWVDLNYKKVNKYEYYVPNIGLVLTKSDRNLYRTTLTTGGSSTTIYFRKKERIELNSISFMGN